MIRRGDGCSWIEVLRLSKPLLSVVLLSFVRQRARMCPHLKSVGRARVREGFFEGGTGHPAAHPPDVLVEKSRELARALGYTAKPAGTAHGFGYDRDYLQYVEKIDKSATRWQHRLGDSQPPAIVFWYRESPRPLQPEAFGISSVSPDDPAPTVSGMILVSLDPQGRLLEFDAVPPQVDKSSGEAPPPDWNRLFEAAGLDISRFSPAMPQWTPLGMADARAAWTGSLPGDRASPVRVEAAAWRGKPTYFQIVGPWTRPGRMQSFEVAGGIKAVFFIACGMMALLLAATVLLARRNLRRERGDLRGAGRLAGFTAAAFMLIWIFSASHVAGVGELMLVAGALSSALLLAACVWILYMAVEPIARRRWPYSVIGWNRLLAGGFRDPVVGHDVLVGISLGMVIALLDLLGQSVLSRFGATAPTIPLSPLLGVQGTIGSFLKVIPYAVNQALVGFVLIFVLRTVLRRDWLAAAAFVLFEVILSVLATSASPVLAGVFAAAQTALVVLVMLRFGLLALMACSFAYSLLVLFPITADFSAWYAGASLFAVLSIAAIAAFAFHTARAGAAGVWRRGDLG